jgi:heterodisulfide reductase subunit C
MEQIILDELDPGFKDEVAKKIGIEEIKPCYACGSCTGVCPVRQVVEDFDPRRIIHMIVLGMRRQVLSSDLIWFCCLCNSCFFVCPQQIKFSRVAAELRALAVAEGYANEAFLKQLEAINPYLQDLCRRTLFSKVKEGFRGPHVMPCWRKHTNGR